MFEINLLGNGGMMPYPNRYLTSLYARCNGTEILVDSGEGTQLALREKGLSCKNLNMLLVTHFHGDHTLGIPGMLLLAGNQGKTSPLTIVGPKGIESVIKSLLVVAPALPFELKFIELNNNIENFNCNEIEITAFKVKHSIECYGFTFYLPRKGKFDFSKAEELNIPKRYWHFLQNGETVEVNNAIYTPDMVMGASRKGIKVTYTTDTRPCKNIVDNAKNSDLFICEGMYGDHNMLNNAKEKKHMMFSEAATLASQANVKELWLTHYSPSLKNPKDYMDETCKIFKNTKAYTCGGTIDLNFLD